MRSLLISAYVLNNQSSEATKLISEALKKNGKDVSALIEQGRLLLVEGKFEDVERDMRNVIQSTPNLAEAHYLLARALRKSKKLTARQELTQALALDPRLLAARTDLSEMLRESNAFPAAQELVDQAPPDQRRSLELTIEQNWIWIAKGDHAALQKGFDALRKPVQIPTLLIQDSVFQTQRKEYPAAIQQAEAALKINPRDLRAVDALASAYVSQKLVGEAIAKVRERADAEPGSAQLRYYYATWLLKADRKEEARLALRKALEIDGAFVPARLTMAQVELADRAYDAARQEVNSVLRAETRNAPALMLAGVIEESSGNFDGAIQAYRKVREADATNPLAMNNLAYLLAEHGGDLDEALKYAEEAMRVAPESGDVADTLGWILFRRGMFDNAVRHLQEADKRRPAAVTKYHLAMAYHRSGAKDRALESFSAGMKINPDLMEAKLAQAFLAK